MHALHQRKIQVEQLIFAYIYFLVNWLYVAAGRTSKFAACVYCFLKIHKSFCHIKETLNSNFSSITAHSSQADCNVYFISANPPQLKTCCGTLHLWNIPAALSLLLSDFVITRVTLHTHIQTD